MTIRPGYALVVALLVVAILSIAAAGVLALGARESEIARAMARRSAARHAAESAVGQALAGWSTHRHRELTHGEVSGALPVPDLPGPGGSTVAASYSVTRLGHELFLVRGISHHADAGLPATGHAGVLVRTIDPETLTGAFPAAVAAMDEARLDGGVVDGGQPCSTGVAAPVLGATGVLAPSISVSSAATVVGTPPTHMADPPPLPTPDLFEPPLLQLLAGPTLSGGTIEPRPHFDAHGCQAIPSNWGAVSTASPCHDHLPFVHVAGDLTVQGGEGRGFLLADGDLVLDEVRFHGVIMARGRVTVAPGTHIRGVVRAGSVHILGGSVTYDPCSLATALAAGGLDRPFRPRHRLWLPMF